MHNRIVIKVADLVGTPVCISAEDAQMVFETLKSLLEKGNQITVSFDRVTMMISLFLNVAIGQLYGSFNEDQIRSKLQVEGLSEDDMELLKRVVDNAKKYYTNPQDYDLAWQDEGEEDE